MQYDKIYINFFISCGCPNFATLWPRNCFVFLWRYDNIQTRWFDSRRNWQLFRNHKNLTTSSFIKYGDITFLCIMSKNLSARNPRNDWTRSRQFTRLESRGIRTAPIFLRSMDGDRANYYTAWTRVNEYKSLIQLDTARSFIPAEFARTNPPWLNYSARITWIWNQSMIICKSIINS